jgi:hypothetical protein
MFPATFARPMARIALLFALVVLVLAAAVPFAHARPAVQAKPQLLKLTSVDGDTRTQRAGTSPAAPREVNATPLIDQWRAAGKPRGQAVMNTDVLDKARPSLAAQPDQATPTGTLFGLVTNADEPTNVADKLVFLMVVTSSGYDLGGLYFTESDGSYAFTDIPAFTSNAETLLPRLEIWYLNFSFEDEALDDSLLYKVYGPYVTQIVANTNNQAPSFDISDVVLGEPGIYAREFIEPFNNGNGTQVNFTWNTRAGGLGSREYYQICIYDPLTLDPDTESPVILCSTVDVTNGTGIGKNSFAANVDSFPADYPFFYDRPYYWYVVVYETVIVNDRVFVISDGGTSFYENTIVFRNQPDAPPPPEEDPGGDIGSGAQKPWTVLVYMAADNELGDTTRVPNPESNIKRQWESLKTIAPNYAASITVVTYTDFYNDGSTQICNISVNPAQCQELGEQNSADPAQLQNFITQARSSYPAENSILVLATHGHSVVGIGFDQSVSEEGAVMTPNQVRAALTNGGISANKFDIIFYNACLMATLETATDTAPFADYLVASTNRLWVVNIYQELLDGIAAQSNNPGEVAKGIVSAYTNRVTAKVPGGVYSNLTAFDLSKAEGVASAVSNLGTALDAAITADQVTNRTLIDAARANVQMYDSSANNLIDAFYNSDGDLVAREEDAFVDVKHFAELMAANGPATARDEANQVLAALNGFVIGSQQRAGKNKPGPDAQTFTMDNASGLALYFPNGSTAGRQATYNEAYLFSTNYQTYNTNSQWDDFLRSYIGSTISQAPGGVGRRGEPIAGNTFGVLYVPMARR